MGCCNSEYRKVVNEKEENLNQKGKDSLPLSLKVIMVLVSVGAISVYYLL